MLTALLFVFIQTAPAVSAAPVTPPKPIIRPGQSIFPDAYPAEAQRLQQEGKATVLLSVDAKGKVVGCAIKQSSGSKSLDEASCAAGRRIRFSPALDREGKPVAGEAPFPFNWKYRH